jgi:neutral ceramidase
VLLRVFPCVLCVLCGVLFPVTARAELLAGAAKVSITPDPKAMPYVLGGYIGPERQNNKATGVHDTCYARALALSDGQSKCVLVSLDLCFMPANVKSAVMQRLAATGLPASAVFLSATHTHSAPDPLLLHNGNTDSAGALPAFDPKLLDWFADRIAQAIAEANGRLRPARIGCGQMQGVGLNRNRRGENLTDDEMSALRVNDADGKPLAAVFVYAAHPTCYGADMLQVSGDWSGEFERQMEEALPGAVVLFLNGAEGDASVNGAEGATPSERIQVYVSRIKEKARSLYEGIQTAPQAQMSAWTQEAALGEPKPHPFFLLAAAQFRATPDQARAYVRRMMPRQCEMSFLRVGDALFMGFPGEPTATIGLAAKKMAKEQGMVHPIVVALTNGWLGYLVSPEQYRTGKYESVMSFYGDSIGTKMLDGIRAGLSRR